MKIKGIIHVDAGWKGKGPLSSVDETKWLTSINLDSNPKILGIIVNANLENWAKVESVLNAHLDTSNLVKGIRETLAWQPNKRILNGSKKPDLINTVNWIKGFEIFSKFNLSFEATIYHNQIHDLAKLAESYPNIKVMVSHLATPVAVAGEFGGMGKTKHERDQIYNTWKDSISRLAENQNVNIKLSGLGMPICGFGWNKQNSNFSNETIADSFAPYINHAIDSFGIDRCFFGSNYPIDKVSFPLTTLIEAYKIILEDLTDHQRSKIFYMNALNFYNINQENI